MKLPPTLHDLAPGYVRALDSEASMARSSRICSRSGSETSTSQAANDLTTIATEAPASSKTQHSLVQCHRIEELISAVGDGSPKRNTVVAESYTNMEEPGPHPLAREREWILVDVVVKGEDEWMEL